MQKRFSSGKRTNFQSLKKIKDISLIIPQIRAEFYVRLFSLLGSEPEISYEGYGFIIEDKQNDKIFSAELTGFGLGYFAADESEETKLMILDFHTELFNSEMKMKACKMEFEHDFGKTILGFENGKVIEQDISDE